MPESTFRSAAETDGRFPYASNTVPFILIEPDAAPQWAQKVNDKLILVTRAKQIAGSTLLAVWPGNWRTDVFKVDDLAKAEEELFKR